MKQFLILVIAITLSFRVIGQTQPESDSKYKFSASSFFIGSTKDKIPFWFRTNKFGAIPMSGLGGGFRGSIQKEYFEKKNFDWGLGIDAIGNFGHSANIQVINAYFKIKKGAFQIKLGRSSDVTGIADSSLSSGSFSVSGNALGIPKAELSIPNYTYVPYTKGFIAIKGNFSYGIIGNEPISQRSYTFAEYAFTNFHQKSFYLQLGRLDSRLKLAGGFNHNVTWGDENNFFTSWNLSEFKTAIKAISGGVHKQSKVGNHIGSIDQKIQYDFSSTTISAYHQFFYEVGGLAYLNNIKDGLFGLVIQNRLADRNKAFRWNKLLVEVFTSKSQGGELNAKATPSGDEDYYNNYLYLNGWRYKSENIGNNFITNSKYIRKELPILRRESHSNNRLYLIHLGSDLDIYKMNFVSKVSFSRNFGTYATSPIGNTTGGNREINPPPYFYPVNQLSASIELSKFLKRDLQVGFGFAIDQGDLLYNSVGAYLSLKKIWK